MSEFARALPRATVQIMKINGSTALVTGANRGLGRAFVQALRDAGCTKIYAAARTIEGAARDAVVEPVQLDITKIGQVSSAARTVPRRQYPDQQCRRRALRPGARRADDG